MLRINLQVVLTIVLASFLVSTFTPANWKLVTFVLGILFLAMAWCLVSKALTRSKSSGLKELQAEDSYLASLNITEAKQMAELLLADSSKFTCTESSSKALPNLDDLPASVIYLFERYERISIVYGDAVLNRRLIQKSTHSPSYLRIGEELGDCDIALKPGQETIYEIDDGDPSDFRSYPSIYHWIISIDRVIYGKKG